MRKYLPIPASIAALAVVMLVAALPAFGTTPNSALIKRIAKLEAKSTALQKNVTTLQAKVKTLQGNEAVEDNAITTLKSASSDLVKVVAAHEQQLGCMKKIAPIGWFGDPASHVGYMWYLGNNTFQVTTGLDVAPAGQTPSFYAVTADASCASTSGAAFQAFQPHASVVSPLHPALGLPLH